MRGWNKEITGIKQDIFASLFLRNIVPLDGAVKISLLLLLYFLFCRHSIAQRQATRKFCLIRPLCVEPFDVLFKGGERPLGMVARETNPILLL
jgi:hypothetical protein